MGSVEPLLAASILVALAYLAAAVIVVVTMAVRTAGPGEERLDDRHDLLASRFTLPVSLVVPVTTTAEWRAVPSTIEALVRLNYPSFEMIVVADEVAPDEWAALQQTWHLEAREIFFRRSLATAPIRMMYRSARDSRLILVRKEAGPVADALNCGVNLARFRHVAGIEPGLVFDANALLNAMSAPLREPATVVAATSHVEVRGGIFQALRSIRSFMASRLIWRHLRSALGSSDDAVVVWRRDALERVGGFSSDAIDPVLDMMVRLQTSAPTADGAERVVRTAEVFGHRPPRTLEAHIRHVVRRRRAVRQAVASLPAAHGARSIWWYLFMSEAVHPLVQAWVLLATALAAVAEWLPWLDVAFVGVLLVAGNAIVSTAALLVRGAMPRARAAQPAEGAA